MTQPFVAAEFKVPERLETPEFRLRMLTVHDVVKDYDAVMSSVEHLSQVWPGSGWPEGLTLEQNLIDLGWHQKEFQRRHDAVVYFWVRQSELGKGLDARLSSAVRSWIAKDWPFENAAYPGRDIEWEAWRAIPDEKR